MQLTAGLGRTEQCWEAVGVACRREGGPDRRESYLAALLPLLQAEQREGAEQGAGLRAREILTCLRVGVQNHFV